MDFEFLIRFLLAALWGGLVGAEREYRSKSAGFRTMIMISLGSCFFTTMSLLIGQPGSSDRIASNIVTGIGFLGAGVIFHSGRTVSGITTAATIWAVAAVGMGIGAGYYFASTCASLFILVILALFPYVERRIDELNQSKVYTIHFSNSLDLLDEFEKQMESQKLKFKLNSQQKEGNDYTASWLVQGHADSHKQFIALAMRNTRIQKFTY